MLERFTCGLINVDGQMTIKQSAPFGSHSCKGLAAKNPPVVGDGSPSCWCSHLLKWTKAVKAPPVVGEGSNSCQQSWTKAAMATIPPPVIGGDGRWWQWVPQSLAETDGDDPKCVARTTNFSKQVTFTSFAARSPWSSHESKSQ